MERHGRAILKRIFNAGLRAVDPEAAVRREVGLSGGVLRVGDRSYEMARFRRVIVVGAGKGAAPMAKALEEILADRITSGLIVVKYGHGLPLARLAVMEAGHPIPDEAGVLAAQAMLRELDGCSEDDLVLCVFSGGASALLPAPRPPVTLSEKQATTRLLLECGATIQEINAIRKHLSFIKGGGLARAAYPATVVSLILSDVVGDPPDVIASGPTVPDPSTFSDCMQILNRYGIGARIPENVYRLIERGEAGDEPETLKRDHPVFQRVQNLLVGNNRAALLAARDEAVALGYEALILTSQLQGAVHELAHVIAAVAREIVSSGHPVPPPACILLGGEPTVVLQGKGKGGRCQQLALATAVAIEGLKGVDLLCAGTDGTDGPTDAAGAFADGGTVERARAVECDPSAHLAQNDAYHLFERLGDLFVTGPTRTNVMDVICLLVNPHRVQRRSRKRKTS